MTISSDRFLNRAVLSRITLMFALINIPLIFVKRFISERDCCDEECEIIDSVDDRAFDADILQHDNILLSDGRAGGSR